MALGEIDYGLMGVVGSLAVFVSFFNSVMAVGVGRFYAISIGEASRDPMLGLERCREWFTTAVVIHTLLPTTLMILGVPSGEWVVRHFLTIPPDRIESCVLVWRYTCISCFVGMVSVPYHAMYGAKQEIAELTIYSFVTTTLNVIFLYYAIHHPGFWLVKYVVWSVILSVIPSLIISIRSIVKYQECRVRIAYFKCWFRIRQMVSYCGWLIIGALAKMMRAQGIVVLVNKFFGPRVNAAMAIGNTVSSQCTTLCGSMTGAFWPAIMNAYGAGQIEKAKDMCFRVCRYGLVLILIFAIPLMLEIREVLHLWLRVPPKFTAGLCICVLIMMVVDRSTEGQMIAINAKGKVSLYQVCVGGVVLLTVPIALVFFLLGRNVYYAGFTMIITTAVCSLIRVVFARVLVSMSMRYWLFHVIVPIILASCASFLTGILPQFFMSPSFFRVCISTLSAEIVFLSLSWIVIMTSADRVFVLSKIKMFMPKIGIHC